MQRPLSLIENMVAAKKADASDLKLHIQTTFVLVCLKKGSIHTNKTILNSI